MRSPVSNEFMLVLELAGVEIDYCPLTRGIWLDAGELEVLYGDEDAAKGLLSSFIKDERCREPKVRCPICRKKMEKVVATKNIIIDRCTMGHGLWFDEGELIEVLRSHPKGESEKIIALLKDMFKSNIRIDKQ